jgi:hypothetical protein
VGAALIRADSQSDGRTDTTHLMHPFLCLSYLLQRPNALGTSWETRFVECEKFDTEFSRNPFSTSGDETRPFLQKVDTASQTDGTAAVSIRLLQARSQNSCETRMLVSSCPSAWNNSSFNWRIFVKFRIVVFFTKLCREKWSLFNIRHKKQEFYMKTGSRL